MKRIIISILISCFVFIPLAYAKHHHHHSSASSLPSGSYLQTCTSCYMKPNNILSCICRDPSNFPHKTSLQISENCESIDNINGHLKCKYWNSNYQPPFNPQRPQNPVFNAEAGPIWNQYDAQNKCPNICQNYRSKWTGQWTTTIPGQMSICECQAHHHKQQQYRGFTW